jgi:predicted membrane protein (TIGR00267 family)
MKITEALEGASFGLTDGVICALGIMVGVAAATSDTTTVLLAGTVGGVADAFGNSIGFYVSQLTERSVQKHDIKKGARQKAHTYGEAVMSGIASFIMTIAIFGILITPYIFMKVTDATAVSFVIAIVLLMSFGAYVSRLSGESAWKVGLWYSFLGVVGALVSYWIGLQLKTVFNIPG